MRLANAVAIALLLASTSAASAAMSEADCTAAFQKADSNSDGTLTENEAANYMAALRTADKTGATTLTRADFLEHCKAGRFDVVSRPMDPGAPLSGANSFTEGQARDRALAAGFTNVSPLKKDDSGVWRGTASKDGKSGSVAIDFKGNVVAN